MRRTPQCGSKDSCLGRRLPDSQFHLMTYLAVGAALLHVWCFFCTSRGAMCAGSAQVTLVELRESCCCPGCTPTKRQNKKTPTPQPENQKTTTPKRTPNPGNNLLRNSCGLAEIESEGETGAMNSAMRSVYLVLQQTRKCLVRAS